MKIPFKNIESFAKKPPANIAAVLVYGPDEGLIRERLSTLTKNIVADIHDPFNVVEFSADQLAENPARLMDEVKSISMLGGRRVIRVRDASDKTTSVIKEVVSNIGTSDNFILLAASELPPRSTLRSFFENAENAAALPCYVDDERDISRVIADQLRQEGYTLPSDALTYMAANVVGDRGVARSEVDKLITYMNGVKNIALDDVIACVGNSASLSLDGLAKSVASGQFAEADKILTFVLSEGMPAVTVLRNLQNYFLRLHLTKSRLQKGESVEEAVRKLKPPLFFKMKDAFEFQVSSWSLTALEQALALLASVEAKCKQTGQSPETLTSRAILSLSQMGAKAAKIRRRA